LKSLANFGNDVNHEKFAVNLKSLCASRLPTHQVRHICKAHKADTQKPTLQKSLPCANAQATLCGWTQTHIIDDRGEGRTYNMGIAAIGAGR